MADWLGTWRNQYGSTVMITAVADGRVEGEFRTALPDSAFHGQTIKLYGAAAGDVIAFSSAGVGPAGAAAVSYTGLLRDGKLQTMWYVVADAAISAARPGDPAQIKAVDSWRALTTSLDSFERVDD